MQPIDKCPICNQGKPTRHIEQVQSTYKGYTIELPLHYLICDVCGSDFAGMHESETNRNILLNWRKEIDLTSITIDSVL